MNRILKRNQRALVMRTVIAVFLAASGANRLALTGRCVAVATARFNMGRILAAGAAVRAGGNSRPFLPIMRRLRRTANHPIMAVVNVPCERLEIGLCAVVILLRGLQIKGLFASIPPYFYYHEPRSIRMAQRPYWL